MHHPPQLTALKSARYFFLKLLPSLGITLLTTPVFIADASALSSPSATVQSAVILAQVIPPDDGTSPSLDPLPEAEPLPALPQPEELLGPEFSPQPPTEPSVPDATTVIIQRFEILGSTVFDEGDFAPITEPYLNRPVTFRDIVTIRDAINQLYQENGYITSGAIIPPQALQNGIAQLQIVEGSVEEIIIAGAWRLKTG